MPGTPKWTKFDAGCRSAGIRAVICCIFTGFCRIHNKLLLHCIIQLEKSVALKSPSTVSRGNRPTFPRSYSFRDEALMIDGCGCDRFLSKLTLHIVWLENNNLYETSYFSLAYNCMYALALVSVCALSITDLEEISSLFSHW